MRGFENRKLAVTAGRIGGKKSVRPSPYEPGYIGLVKAIFDAPITDNAGKARLIDGGKYWDIKPPARKKSS